MLGGAKQTCQEYFLTNNHKSEFDKFGEWANSSLSQQTFAILPYNRLQIHSLGLAFLVLCLPCLFELMWCSFAGNLLVVTRDRTTGFTLRSYGDGVGGGASAPIQYRRTLLCMEV